MKNTDKGTELFTIENLYQAYRACRRHKRGTINALRFEAGLLDNLCDLRDELVKRTYRPSTSICFVQKRPKLREIFAADFRDRVVHHLLVGYLEPILEPRFIHDSYACRKDKGVHAAVTRLGSFLNKATANGTMKAWYLKEDVSGFFMNIDKKMLYDIICRYVKREEVRWLAWVIVFHDCTEDYHFKGNRSLLNRIPQHKTLFGVSDGKGLPIGNLTSQFFANVYLNELDHFIKRKLGCHYYLRYCDDFLLLDRSPQKLSEWRDRIEEFLADELLLKMNHRQHQLRPVSNGINFLGYIVRRRYILVRKRVVNHFREKLDHFDKRLAVRRRGRVTSWRYPLHVCNLLRSTVASYLGHLHWANSNRLVRSLFQRHPVLRANFLMQDDQIVARYLLPKKIRGLRKSYRWWIPPAPRPIDPPDKKVLRPLWVQQGEPPRILVFFPVGRFYEFYDAQALAAHEALGLKLVTGLRGFRHGCGFHRRWLGRFIHKALRAGYPVALVQAERQADGKMRRRLARLYSSEPGFSG